MINKVSFTGNEGMLVSPLTKPVEQQVVKASTYIEEALPKAKEVVKTAVEAVYTSPFAPTNVTKAMASNDAGKLLSYLG